MILFAVRVNYYDTAKLNWSGDYILANKLRIPVGYILVMMVGHILGHDGWTYIGS